MSLMDHDDYSPFVEAIEVTYDKNGQPLFNGFLSLYFWLSQTLSEQWTIFSDAQRCFFVAELLNELGIDPDAEDNKGRVFFLHVVSLVDTTDEFVIRVYDSMDNSMIFEDRYTNIHSNGYMSHIHDIEGLHRLLIEFGELIEEDTLLPTR